MPWWSAIVGPFRPWSFSDREGNQISICLFQTVVLPFVEYEDGVLTVKGIEIAVTVRSVKASRILVHTKG